MRQSTIFTGFRHRYPQKFLDELAKSLGIEWTKVEFKCVPAENVPVCPSPPPAGILFYMDVVAKAPDGKTTEP
jgi:hypothetical protein